MTVCQFQQQIRAFRDARDWMQFHNPKDMAVAISIEAAELQEHFLWVTPQQSHTRAQERPDKVKDEIADIGMYLFEMADNLGIDLLAASPDTVIELRPASRPGPLGKCSTRRRRRQHSKAA